MSYFKTYSPHSGALLREYAYASAIDVSSSLTKLSDGFRRWKTASFSERQKILRPALSLFNKSREELAQMITLEMGKPYSQSLAEIDKSLKTLEYMCTYPCPSLEALETQTVKAFSDSPNKEHQIYHKPKGVILSVMPWNFPFWQAVRMIFPTLLAGNTVLLKHSEVTPSIGDFIKKILAQVDLNDIFDHLIFEHSLTESVIADERVQGVSLTGSVKAGLLLSRYAGQYMKRGVFELGGSDAHFVLQDADIEKSAASIAKSRLQNTGQSCIAAKRVVVSRQVSKALIDQLVVNFNQFSWGDPFDRATTLGPLAAARFKLEDEKHFNFVKEHCEVVFERYPDEAFIKASGEDSSNQAFVPLRILKARKLNPELLDYLKTNEFFSPTLILLEFSDLEEGLDLVNQTQFGLGGSVYSKNIAEAQKLALRFESGLVAINDAVASNAVLPFGGVKYSGIGRELGAQGFTEFTDIQVVSTTSFT